MKSIIIGKGWKKWALYLRMLFKVTPRIWNHCFYCKGWRFEGLLLVFVFLPLAFSWTHHGSTCKLAVWSLHHLFQGNALRLAVKGEEKKVGFLVWLPNLFLSSIILRVRQFLTMRSTCTVSPICGITLCRACCKFVCAEATHTVPDQPIAYDPSSDHQLFFKLRT